MRARSSLIAGMLFTVLALQSCGSSTGPLVQGTYDVRGIINVGPPHVAANDTVSLTSHGRTLAPLLLDQLGHATTQLDPGRYEATLIIDGLVRASDSNVVIRSNTTTYDTLIVCPMCM